MDLAEIFASWVGIQKSSQTRWIINPTTDQFLYYFQLLWTHIFWEFSGFWRKMGI